MIAAALLTRLHPRRAPHGAGGASAPRRALAVVAVAALFAELGASPARAACSTTNTAHCLQGSRFRVEVDWKGFGNDGGKAQTVSNPTTDTGLFYFFGPSNWELLVKVLNACGTANGANDRFWVFAAAATTLQYTLKVTDTQTGAVKTYSNPLGQSSAAVTDTQAFATCNGGPQPTPTPPPSSSLESMKGTWDFVYTIISTFTDRFRLQTIKTINGTPFLQGLDEFNGTVLAARVQDLVPGSTLPYDFGLLDPGIISCGFFVFNKTSDSTVSGQEFVVLTDSSGNCATIFGDGNPMTGARVSTSAGASSAGSWTPSDDERRTAESLLLSETGARATDTGRAAPRSEEQGDLTALLRGLGARRQP